MQIRLYNSEVDKEIIVDTNRKLNKEFKNELKEAGFYKLHLIKSDIFRNNKGSDAYYEEQLITTLVRLDTFKSESLAIGFGANHKLESLSVRLDKVGNIEKCINTFIFEDSSELSIQSLMINISLLGNSYLWIDLSKIDERLHGYGAIVEDGNIVRIISNKSKMKSIYVKDPEY